jgi:hypothetical protein
MHIDKEIIDSAMVCTKVIGYAVSLVICGVGLFFLGHIFFSLYKTRRSMKKAKKKYIEGEKSGT